MPCSFPEREYIAVTRRLLGEIRRNYEIKCYRSFDGVIVTLNRRRADLPFSLEGTYEVSDKTVEAGKPKGGIHHGTASTLCIAYTAARVVTADQDPTSR